MMLRRTTLASLVIAAFSFGVAAVLYDRLPASIPVHWSIHGKVDWLMPKPWGVFIYPATIGFMALLALILPAVSPRGFGIERFARVFDLITTAMIVFFTCLMAVIFAGALGMPVPMNRAVPAFAGLLMVVIGNVMGKVTRNFFIGIKTPWTLASEEVWLRTHRLGGRLFVVGGLALFGAAVLGLDLLIPLVMLIAVAPIVIAYSFLVYRRLEGRAGQVHEK